MTDIWFIFHLKVWNICLAKKQNQKFTPHATEKRLSTLIFKQMFSSILFYMINIY